MMQTDPIALILIQISILVAALFAAYKDISVFFKNQGIDAEVVRGDKSMSALYTVYGAAIASLLVLTSNTSSLEGNKVLFITLNFLLLSYLFLFNSWFRNKIFFNLHNRARQD